MVGKCSIYPNGNSVLESQHNACEFVTDTKNNDIDDDVSSPVEQDPLHNWMDFILGRDNIFIRAAVVVNWSVALLIGTWPREG